MLTLYDQIAPYYDQMHARLTADVEFVLELAGRPAGPVLELGCGSGRLLLPLARAGHHVTGLDTSAVMLALARQKLAQEPAAVQQRVTLREADMRNFTLPERDYRLVIISYNTFMHLDPAAQLQALRAARRHLATDGRLIIDLPNPFTVASTPGDNMLTLEYILEDEQTGHTVLVLARSRLAEAEQALEITWLFDRVPPAGGKVERTVVTGRYYYLYPHEIELRLAEAGLTLQALYGDYGEQGFSEEAARLIVLASL